MASSSGTLPLHCSVCPKRPTFSDVSHLLTHVASKGHLSHYYKVKVRASHDLEARSVIDRYDRWYDQWNVEELMSHRMHQKDQKKRSRVRTQGPFCGPPRRHLIFWLSSHPADVPLTPAIGATHPPKKKKINARAAVDPSLSFANGDAPVKEEGLSFDDDLEALLDSPELKKPKLHLWDIHHPGSHAATPLDCCTPDSHTRSSTLFPSQGEEDLDPTAVDEATRLKGAIFPGMDIFDSATAEMKRKRNQRKDVSVLDQLEQNSLEVEPTEIIHFPFGQVKRERQISGRLDSSSPSLSELPAPLLKKKAAPRKVLRDKDVNKPGVKHSQSQQRRTTSSRNQPPTQPNRKKPRSGLQVHRDGDDMLGDANGLHVLNSSFRPAMDHSPTLDLYNHGHPGFLPYMPVGASNIRHFTPALATHLQYGPPNTNYYTPLGYDLSTFLTHQLPKPPYAHLRAHHNPWGTDSPSASFDGDQDAEECTPRNGDQETQTSAEKADDDDTEVESLAFHMPRNEFMFEEELDDQDDGLIDLEHEFGQAYAPELPNPGH